MRLHVGLAVVLLALGVFLRAANLGAPAFCCDEFYDVFAARSWLAGEGLRVPGREYTRARLNTYLTAGAFALLGESEGAARVPALLFGVGTMALAYAVGLALFGPVAGVVALTLVALSADAVDVSRFARLYSPLTFFSLLAAFATYRAVEGRDEGPRPTAARGRWLALAAAAGLLATHLHPIALALGPAVLAYATLRSAALAVGGRRAAARPYAWLALALAVAAAAALLLPAVRGR
ncbi:MAG TPA: glycosyltransferase family 39 protein, partial [Thermodesulfobacteriota bacterium]